MFQFQVSPEGAPSSRPSKASRGRTATAFVLAAVIILQQLMFVPLVQARTVPNPAAMLVSSGIVISQVYGGGGNAGATFTHDFAELFNRGTTPVNINGWSSQYASATGTGNFGANTGQIADLPNVAIQPDQYDLLQEARGAVGVHFPLLTLSPRPARVQWLVECVHTDTAC